MIRLFCLVVAVAVFLPLQAKSHEYYLMPETFTPPGDKPFAVRHRLGQRFNGNEVPYIGVWNIRSEAWKDGNGRETRGQDGDRPALVVDPAGPGLMSIVHQSNIDFLTFKTWEKFRSYVTKEGLDHALSASEQGIKPKTGLKEAYARFAKTLVSIDANSQSRDTATGLKIELIALAHPLLLKADEPMPVELRFDGQPLAGATIKVFVGIDSEFAHRVRTDRHGRAFIPADGPGPYLLNAIHMTEPESPAAISAKADWESFWASLTFERAF